MPPKVSVITPFLNGLDLLPDYERATLGAELIIVDNGSDQETAVALQTLPPERGRVLRNEQNTGFAAANNQGYREATGDIIVFLNSDIAADPIWLKFVCDDVKDGALYGPSLSQQLVYGMWLPYIEGWCIAGTRATWDKITNALCGTPLMLVHGVDDDQELAHIHQSIRDAYGNGTQRALVMPHGVTTELIQLGVPGPWDSTAYPGPYWEDNDLCWRALQLDIQLIQTQWPIQHKGGRTAGALVKHGATFEQNRATFASRVKAEWEKR